jgi:hypothetical protein
MPRSSTVRCGKQEIVTALECARSPGLSTFSSESRLAAQFLVSKRLFAVPISPGTSYTGVIAGQLRRGNLAPRSKKTIVCRPDSIRVPFL